MRKKVAIAVVALLGGALMLFNHEALAHDGGSAEAVSTVGGSAEVGSAAEHSEVEDLAAMDMDAATTVIGADKYPPVL
jgi:uncharacterized protein YggE